MSHQATTWVMEFSKSKLAARLVLGAIAHRISNDNGEAFPSIARIAKEANVSEAAVHASLKKLQEIGELEVQLAASKHGTNVYRMPKFLEWHASLHPEEGGTKSVPPARKICTRGVQNLEKRGPKSVPEPSGTISRPSEAAPLRSRQDTRSEPPPAVENPERQFNLQLERAKAQTALPGNGRPSDPLRAELYDGIFRKKVANVFFDCRQLPFRETVRTCISEAVTSLVTNRTAKLMRIPAGDIEKLALLKLGDQFQVLEAIDNFETRQSQTVQVVVRMVYEAAAEAVEALEQFPQAS